MINWVKRSSRSVITWLLLGGAAFLFISGVLLDGDTEMPEDNGNGTIPAAYFQASGVLLFLTTVVIAVWRGTGKPPRATAADVVFILSSPISTRLQFGYLMFREIAATLSILTLVVILSMLGPLIRAVTTDPDALLDVFASPTIGIWLIILTGGSARFAVWVSTEQIVVRDALGGHRIRQLIRGVIAATGVGILAFIFVPVIQAAHGDWIEFADDAANRVIILATVPPLSWASTLFGGEGPTAVALIGLAALAALITSAALLAARDFAEPIAVTAERQTDARGQAIEAGSDLQWSTMSQIGAAPRLRFSVRPFGRGPWALFWSSLTRWVRYQFAVAWISMIVLLGFGVTVAFLIRFDIIPFFWAWILVLSMPFFGSYNLFLDELRKPFLFLTPGPAWKRLVAAGAISVLDSFISSVVLVLILIGTRARPLLESLTLLVFAAALAFLIQASVGLVQVVLPSWFSRKVRTGLTFAMNLMALLPAVTTVLVGLALVGPAAGAIAGVLVAFLTAIIILIVSVFFFDRLEMPG
jgi:hypothetical protein